MKKFILTLVATMFSLYSLYGVPASPQPYIYIQPDGSEIVLTNRGDEYYHWEETLNHDIVVNNNGYYEYATINNNEIVPSGIRVSTQIADVQKSELSDKADLITLMLEKRRCVIARMDSMSKLDVSEQDGEKLAKAAPTTLGELKVLCILIGFPDKPFIKTQTNFSNMWNQVGYNYLGSQGSVKDFYYENSFGYTNVTATVVGPYVASHNSSYYDTGANSSTIENSNVRELITEALVAAKNDVQFQNFDVNGDKYVDAVHVVFAGYGKESSISAGIIWSHRWSLSSAVWQGIYKAKDYFCTPELAGGSGTDIAPMGTVCHEYGHNLGAPDYYDLNYSGFTGTGHWDVMCNGSWNNGGRCPTHHNPYTKLFIYNWPIFLQALVHVMSNTIRTLPPSHNNNIIGYIPTNTSGEFFLLENRKKQGFNSAFPAGNNDGLLIYHIHKDIQDAISNHCVNTLHPQKCYIVSANAISNPNSNPSSYGSDDTQWAFPTNNQIFFTSNSIPSAVSWAGDSTGVNLCFIQKTGNNIKFVVNPKINGPAILDSLETYSVSNVPDCAQIKWTYTANVQPNHPIMQILFPPISFPDGDSTTSISVKRGKYRNITFPIDTLVPHPGINGKNELSSPMSVYNWQYYTGTVTLKATITSGGESYNITKTITLPEEEIAKIRKDDTLPSYGIIHSNPASENIIPIHTYQIIEGERKTLSAPYTIELWDNTYGCVKRVTTTSSPISLDVGGLPAGLYQIILLIDGEIKATSKIIKQ